MNGRLMNRPEKGIIQVGRYSEMCEIIPGLLIGCVRDVREIDTNAFCLSLSFLLWLLIFMLRLCWSASNSSLSEFSMGVSE